MNILTYTFKRFIQLIPMYCIIITLVFFVSRAFPGDPFLFKVKRISAHQIRIYNESIKLHGLDQPLWNQFLKYVENLVTGNWGESWIIADGYPVWPLVKFAIINSFEFLLLTLPFSFFVGTRLGRWSASKSHRYRSGFVRWSIVVASAIPILLFAMLTQYYGGHSVIFYKYVVGIKSSRTGDPTFYTGMRLLDSLLSLRLDLAIDTFLHYITPGIAFSLPIIALISRQTRSSMLETMQCDYIRTAYAKGCSENRVRKKHAFRNSLIPVVTIMGMSIPLFISNLILVEYLYQLPGFAALFFLAFFFQDYNVLIAITTIAVSISVIGNFLADVAYALVDPRMRY
ncbi:MAG: ABC transporter permease [Promethearchaeota archaeon]